MVESEGGVEAEPPSHVCVRSIAAPHRIFPDAVLFIRASFYAVGPRVYWVRVGDTKGCELISDSC